MKKILILIAFTGFYLVVPAQSEITNVNYLKTERQAVENEIPFPEKTIMSAIDAKMEQMGYKGKNTKGFTLYKGVRLEVLGSAVYDLYFMAERKSRRNRDNSTLTLMLSKGFDDFVTEKSDAQVMKKAKKYLEDIVVLITAYDLELQILDQQETVDKADKKYNDLIDDGQSLEKKLKSIEKDIEDNKKNQEDQRADIEKQKLKLEALKSSRKQ